MARKVLLVDDEQDFLTLMSKLIISWGYDVVTASNGQEALELSSHDRPDVLILDYLMPDINGVELLREMRKAGTRVPAIIFTANPMIKAMEESEELSIAAFIPKISPYVDTQEDLKMTLGLLCR
ncbi:MAG: response regulator [Candidatus Omnitrophica bacterium]|nr:response regulator [Candidatus Omnitrophota bacterium]